MSNHDLTAIMSRRIQEQNAKDLPPVRKTAYMQIDSFLLACAVEDMPCRMELMKRFTRTFR